MDTDTIVGLITVLLMIGGLIFLFVKIRQFIQKKIKNRTGLLNSSKNNKPISLSLNTDVGTCKVDGDKNRFSIFFDSELVSFRVEDGIITEYKAKNSSEYKKYPVGRGYTQ